MNFDADSPERSATAEARTKKARPAVAKKSERRSPCAAEANHDYLVVVGDRVRNARARRGMTRKILARDSGVSERYLAQLEAGQGNISIALLRQIARAMDVPIADLVREGADRPVELTLLLQRLGRLSLEELSEASQMVVERFGRVAAGERRARIALIGLRGAGKSTLGRHVAEALGAPFIEMAGEIERDSGMSLNEIFSLSGQAAYRRYERRALERVLDGHTEVVIATGGSLVSEPATFDLLLNGCFTVWIKASPEEHMRRVVAQGDMRPMAGNTEAMEDLRRILDGRHALYSKADAVVDTTDKPISVCCDELLAIVSGASEPGANKQNIA